MSEPNSGVELPPAAQDLDPRLVQWLAAQTVQDRDARLVEGGAGVQAPVELSTLFVDLPALLAGSESAATGGARYALATLLGRQQPLLHGPRWTGQDRKRLCRWLIVGGPGSGKSTLTTMLPQVLRQSWIARQADELPEPLRADWQAACAGIRAVAGRLDVAIDASILPLRVSLPSYARWIAGRTDHATNLWDHLAGRLTIELSRRDISVELSGRALETAIAGTRIVWIFDGLDEVPRSAGREMVLARVRDALAGEGRESDGIVVATRPQGYEGEFDDLEPIALAALPVELALTYAEKLMRAWAGNGAPANFDERLDTMRAEFRKPEVAALITTPLHTTMATALLAPRGSLPTARHLLFETYFNTIWLRELNKPFDHGMHEEDAGVLRTLHARAGLALHVRSQEQGAARSSLRRREVRELLASVLAEQGFGSDDVREHLDRIMRFAAERLVLLLHASEGEYEFGVRSLQEFFAAQAIVDGPDNVVWERMKEIALSQHWANVLGFISSRGALVEGEVERERVRGRTVRLCEALNRGEVGGPATARCVAGSRLAISMLVETERYGRPWLHDPLWRVALEAVESSAQCATARVAKTSLMSDRAHPWALLDSVEIHTRLGALAADWTGSNAKVRRREVLALAEAQLARDENARYNGWRLLGPLLRINEEGASSLANAHAPRDRESAIAVIDAIIHDGVNAPSWASDFVLSHLEWFPPQLHAGDWWRMRIERYRGDGLFRFWEAWPEVTRLSESILVMRSPLYQGLAWNETEQDEQLCAEWRAWARVLTFRKDPSPENLAIVLESALDPSVRATLLALSESLPWPLLAALSAAQTTVELSAIAASAREGNLGSYGDWSSAERRWESCESDLVAETEAWLRSSEPWSSEIRDRGLVLTAFARIFPTERSRQEPAALFRAISDWIERNQSRAARLIRPATSLGLDGIPLQTFDVLDRSPRHGHEDVRDRTASIPMELLGPNADAWLACLDQRGQTSPFYDSFYFDRVVFASGSEQALSILIDRVFRRPDQWGLLDVINAQLRTASAKALSLARVPPLHPDAPPNAISMHALLSFLIGQVPPEKRATVLSQLVVNDERPIDRRLDLAYGLRGGRFDRDDSISILLAALDSSPPPASNVRDELHGSLFAQIRRVSRPAFATVESWSLAALPSPFLGNVAPRAPFHIVAIDELVNLRLFRETPAIDVLFTPPPIERGQWIVLVGENGVGKTTFLRALALTIASPTVASKLLDERLPMLRNGGEGHVSITLNTGRLSITLRRDDRTELVESTSQHELERPWVVGYGVRRGNARGEKDREAEVGPIGELHTLFDRPASLYNASQWLRDLDGDVLREQRRQPRPPNTSHGPREGLWRAVVGALKALLGVTDVEVDEGGVVYVRHPQFERVRLDGLSDGYLTTAGWVIDLIARWVDRQREQDEPVGADLLRQMKGFVLIDEIDLHLHPMWQLRIMEDIRRLFPCLSFVVTTHNPLTLQGARRGEVYVMRREADRIELVQRDIQPGHDVDRVLFEQFGVAHTFDRETRDLLIRHRELLERDVPPEDAERRKIETQLIERLGDIGVSLRDERQDARTPNAPLRPEERELLAPFLKKS